jgi:hypothetical protein
MKNFNQDSLQPSWDLNMVPPKYEAGVWHFLLALTFFIQEQGIQTPFYEAAG